MSTIANFMHDKYCTARALQYIVTLMTEEKMLRVQSRQEQYIYYMAHVSMWIPWKRKDSRSQ